VTTFLLGSSMAGAGGLMVGLRDTQINHMMGFLPGMKAFTAAVLGGIGNIPGAMFGGYFLGIAEALGAQFMSAEYKDVIGFTLLVIVLIFRPTGIMGEVLATKKM
jgi:branched-chain amino acid transport system permease protein